VKLNPRDDLVSMTAIVAGAVVSVAVTIGSMILSGDDESRDFIYEVERNAWVQFEEVEVSPDVLVVDVAALAMGEIEWEAIGTYKTIEAMTATYPTNELVDRTLDALGSLALDNPDSGFVQGLYLKALRVSEYYAMEGGDERRALWLQGRFDLFAPLVMRYETTGLESIRFISQRLERSCEGSEEERDRLVAVMNHFPDSGDVAALFVQGLEKAWSCSPT
jgi:hypothetical protein